MHKDSKKFSIYDMSYFCTQNQGHRRIFIQKGSENMNKIFKVIWSKSRNCYVVASELAKGHTKASSTGDKTRRLALAAITALMLLPVGGFSYAADTTIMVEPASTTAVEVYTKEGANNTFATSEQLQSDVSATNAEVARKADKATTLGGYGITDAYTKTETDKKVSDARTYTYRKVAAEETAREEADIKLNNRITDVKEYLKGQTVSKTDAAVQDGAVVKAANTIGDNVTKLDAALAKETAARLGADAAQDKVIQQVNENASQGIATLATAYQNEAAAREAKDNELNERITNEANAIHETTNQLQSDLTTETTAREAGDKALDDRITNVKEYVLSETNKNYVSKTDAAVQDGAVVKAANTIGENVTKLDAALAKETADRLGADAAQDKVIQTVNDNLVSSVNTINKNMADGFTALSQTDANELAGRVAADKELVKATNGGLALNDKNVLQKNETTIAEDGTVTTKTTAADTLIMNEGKKNQITLSENGIKVGTGSTVIASDGVFAGGDTADQAKAALNADGSIKGANGDFTVDKDGNVTSKATITGETVTDGKGASMSNGTVTGKTLTDGIATISNGNINTSGTITGGIVTSTGNISAVGDIHAGGAITGASASIQGALTAGSATITGDLTAGGAIQGKSISDGTATMQNGNITGVKNLSAETITTSGNATIGGDLTVNGKLNVDEIDLTKNGIVGDNNVTASTKVAAGEITSYQKATSTKDGSEKESAIDYDENGTSTWAKSTDADGNWKKSTLTVEGSDVTSKVVDSDKNSNESKQTSTESSDVVKDADGNTSTFSQRVKDILQEIKNASGDTLTKVEQTDTAITSQIGDGSAVKSEMTADGITNTSVGGTITNSAKDLVNTATGDMTNTVGGKMLNDVTGDMENKVGGEMKTTVTGKVTEDYKSDLDTKIGGNEIHAVTGNQTVTVSKDRTVNVKGTETENFNAQVTSIKTDQKTSVGGNQTNIVAGNQQNTVSGSKTETVKGSVTEKYGSQATTVDGDQSTNVGGNQSNVVAGNQTNTISGSKTETVKGAVSETYGSQTTKVNGDQSTTVTGKQTNSITGDQVNTIGGSQTTMVTGDSSLSAKNISNTATEKLSNSAADIENKASNSILNQVGDNTSWKMTDGKVVESVKGTDGQTNTTTTTADDTYQSVQNGNNVLAKRTSSTNDNLNITDGTNTYSKITTATSNKQTVTDGKETASTNLTKSASNTYITNGTQTVTNHIAADTTNTVMNEGNNGSRQEQTASQILNRVTDGTDTSEVKQTASEVATSAKDITNTASEKITNQIGDGSKVKSEMTADGITNTAEGGTIYNKSKDILNEASGDILNFADGEIGNVATKITNITGDNTVTSDTNGTTFENKAYNTAIKEGTVTKTTISGNTIETGQATMDYADVMKDLGVRGSTTLGTTANDKLTVNATSTFNENVSMKKDLSVGGTTTTDKLVVNNGATIAGGATVTGGTTTDTLKVTSSSEFGGKATFNDIVKMNKGLSVTGGVTADTVTADTVTADSYKVGDKTYINSNGINANNHKVVNVAPGRIAADSTDAVNGSQLYQTNERVTGVENKVNKLDSRVDKVGANAAALANLHPLEFDADSKWNIAAAVGGYKGETATAIGAFYRPNENVMINVSSSFGTGENMYGGGISLRIGQGGNKARRNATNGLTEREKAMQKQIDSLTNRLDALLSVINPNMSKEFPDVPENHWAYEAVSRLAGNGVIQGYEDGKYHGERTMTRYEMAEIIYNALSKGAKAEKKLVEEFKPELQAMAAQKKA